MGIARNIARLIPNGSGLLPNANIEAVAATKLTGTVPDANAPSGSVLQVALASTSTEQSINTSTFTDLTNLTITITPISATSKFLLTYAIHANLRTSGAGFSVRFVRNGTALYTPSDFLEVYSANAGDLRAATSNQFLDSPSTTSAITYKLQAARYNSQVDFSQSGVQNTFTVMEIAG